MYKRQAQLQAALATKPADRRLGEHLVALGLIAEQDLYAALSLQNNLPLGKPDLATVSISVTRALPAAVARKWRVLPFRIAAGEIYLAGSDLPGDEMHRDIPVSYTHLVRITDIRATIILYLR